MLVQEGPAWLTRGFVTAALRRHSHWELGNDVLYQLCRRHPEHHSVDEIVAKVWLIGRSYAASIERRRGKKKKKGEDFFLDQVGPRIRSARVDRWLAPIKDLRRPNATVVVPVQRRLTDLFRQISKQDKRSLASKYLHFHFPRSVYIFDERVSRGIRAVSPALHLRQLPFATFDDTYARFYLRCEGFHRELEALMQRRLSPREVDQVLLAASERG